MVSLEEETTMQPAQIDFDRIKRRTRGVWMAGDFGRIARYAAKFAEEFVHRLRIQPGTRVLDVACGTGNLAIPAARQGARVWGVDIATNLLEQARQRASAVGLPALFEEGDAERFVPPPAGIPAPVLWGQEQVVKQRLGPYTSAIQTNRIAVPFGFPFAPSEVVRFFRRYFGPAQVAFARLSSDAQLAYTRAAQ